MPVSTMINGALVFPVIRSIMTSVQELSDLCGENNDWVYPDVISVGFDKLADLWGKCYKFDSILIYRTPQQQI